MGTLIDFPTASRSPRSRARNTPATDAPARVKETVVGAPSSITLVTSLDARREAGRRLADLQACKARAQRDRDRDRVALYTGLVDQAVERAHRDARAALYGNPDGDGPAAA